MKRVLLAILILSASTALGQGTVSHIRYGATLPAACSASTGDLFFKTGTGAGTYQCLSTNTWTAVSGSGTVTGVTGSSPVQSTGGTAPVISCPTCITSVPHTITIPIAGSPIATGTTNVGSPAIVGPNISCTINSAKITSPVSGSITVDIWKAASAIPNSGNKISASAPVTLSGASVNTSSSLSGWTTSVSTNDVIWATVATADGVLTSATIVLGCQ